MPLVSVITFKPVILIKPVKRAVAERLNFSAKAQRQPSLTGIGEERIF